MKCPVDQNELRLSERQGVEIDYCPQCRGVWLDRGELDKIIERADDGGYNKPQRREEESWSAQGKSKKKKKNFLGELFEFGE